jgi:hypothetical protein
MTYKPYERNDFEADLRIGKVGEALVKNYLYEEKVKVEVKRDLKWKETGNLYIEQEVWSQVHGDVPGGFKTTDADVWAFVMGKCVLWVPHDTLSRAVLKSEREGSCDWSANPSKGKLITPGQILQMEMRRPA